VPVPYSLGRAGGLLFSDANLPLGTNSFRLYLNLDFLLPFALSSRGSLVRKHG